MRGLNPTFRGRWFHIETAIKWISDNKSLNPTFRGRWFHIHRIPNLGNSTNRCLNPTFRGRWFHIDSIKGSDTLPKDVLILLFVEDGFIYIQRLFISQCSRSLNPTFRGRWFHMSLLP